MRFAVVGAGVVGTLRARAVAASRRAELVAVADVDEAAARRAARGARQIRTTPRWQELVEDPGIDAVVVSTPTPLHAPVALAALQAGKHVLCEKPLAPTVELCSELVTAARRADRVLAVGFNHRYYPAFRFLEKTVRGGGIGAVDYLRVFGGHEGIANFGAEWMYRQPHSGGGVLMDAGLHMVDLTRFVLGDIESVYGAVGARIWGLEGSEDRALAILHARSGVPAFFECSWEEWSGYRIAMSAYGDRGMVSASYAPMRSLVVTRYDEEGRLRRRRRWYFGIQVREKLRGWQSTTLVTFRDELTDLLRRIDGEDVPLADGWAGLRAVEVGAAVKESARTGSQQRLSSLPAGTTG